MNNSLLFHSLVFVFILKNILTIFFEIGSVTYNAIRYAAIAGGKTFSITRMSLKIATKKVKSYAVFAPDKLMINPKHSSEIHRKERYVLSALQFLKSPQRALNIYQN